MAQDTRDPDVELRLALVCYGGVSLAVYMHGVTKELHKLVRASRRFDELADLDAANPFAPGSGVDTEHGYFEALRTLARQSRRVSVTVDIIAGTSAGGINGVILGKAIACDAPQDALKQLWINEGDLGKLLRAPAIGGIKTRAFLSAARLLRKWRQPISPLRGERMSQLLVGAISDMDRRAKPGHTLLPRGGTLDLYVTATDLHGFEVLVPSGAGGASQRDRSHAQVLEFHGKDGDLAGFGEAATPALAFAARATSSFPGAFAPVKIDSFGEEVAGGGSAVNVSDVKSHLRDDYNEAGHTAADAWFVDGGVLDNAPFDLVIEAIGRKRAETEVVRRVLYIQPDPGRPLRVSASGGNGHTAPPGWLAGVWQSVAGVKGSHSILRDLRLFRDMNIRITEINAIAQAQMAQVSRIVAEELERTALPSNKPGLIEGAGDKDDVRRISDAMHERARIALGINFDSYCRLKTLAAGRRLADEMAARFVTPPDSSRSSFVRAAISAWARSRVEWADPDPDRLLEMLGPIDVPYRERRLHFMLAGINGLYHRLGAGQPGLDRKTLDRLKAHAWNLLDQLRDIPAQAIRDVDAADIAFLDAPAVECALLQDPARFAQDHAQEFTVLFTRYREALRVRLGDGSTPLWLAYHEDTLGWDKEMRDELLSRYLGFPLWDGLIFPTVDLSRLPQFTPIGVTQCSPVAAGALPTPRGGKLKGVSLHHFGAFLDAAWRENDYLWGRLDGAEMLLRTLNASLIPGQGGADVLPANPEEAIKLAGDDVCRDVLLAVLDGEEPSLRRVTPLVEELRRELTPSRG